MSENSVTTHRPFGATVLAILAGIAAILAGVHLLQSMGILPYVIGPVSFRDFNLWYALMWGLMVWVYIWLVQMLWHVRPEAWLFLAVITVFNLTISFVAMLGQSAWSDVSLSIIVNAIILVYIMLPGVRGAFGMAKQ
jgi:hypothetical protein